MVLPWYAASRYPAHWTSAALAADLAVICHGGSAVTVDGAAPQAPGQPGDTTSDCPICKALRGLQVAVLAASGVGPFEHLTHQAFLRPADDGASGHVVFL